MEDGRWTASVIRGSLREVIRFGSSPIAHRRSPIAAFILLALVGRGALSQATPGAAPELSPRGRGRALLLAVAREINKRPSDYFGILDSAEQYVAEIDRLPDSLDDMKLAAHERMRAQYDYLDVDDGLRRHAAALVTIGRRTRNIPALGRAFLSLARAAADDLRPDSALAILDSAETELRSETVATTFKEFRNRYALIGTPAAALAAQYWLNAGDARPPIQLGNGTVTLIAFTAQWCQPCDNSYSGLRKMSEKFRDRAFDVVLVTALFGYLGPRRNLTPEDEVAGLRDYFSNEHLLPFKVAINPLPRAPGRQPPVNETYRVGPIPQIVIVDKRGIIRQIVTGWDRANTERLGALIENLLTETRP
jgi:hypothetical protein